MLSLCKCEDVENFVRYHTLFNSNVGLLAGKENNRIIKCKKKNVFNFGITFIKYISLNYNSVDSHGWPISKIHIECNKKK